MRNFSNSWRYDILYLFTVVRRGSTRVNNELMLEMLKMLKMLEMLKMIESIIKKGANFKKGWIIRSM